MTEPTTELSVDHLIDNGAFFSRVQQAVKGQPLKIFIDTLGISTTFGRSQSNTLLIRSDPMSALRIAKIRSTIQRLDSLLEISFAYTSSRDDSNIALMQYAAQLPGLQPHAGWNRYNLEPVYQDPLTKQWTYKYQSDIALISEHDDLIAKGNNHWEMTILHEIGHSLGLEHPFNANDGDSFGNEDSPTTDQTVMAYGSPATWGQYPSWYQAIDLQALEHIWGTARHEAASPPPALQCGAGANRLSGTAEADRFSFNSFDTIPDIITGFNGSGGDKIILSGDAFGGWIGNNKDLYFKTATTARRQRLLYKSEFADIIYNSRTGQLFYNRNEGQSGLGQGGGLFAVLDGAPPLTRANFEVI